MRSKRSSGIVNIQWGTWTWKHRMTLLVAGLRKSWILMIIWKALRQITYLFQTLTTDLNRFLNKRLDLCGGCIGVYSSIRCSLIHWAHFQDS